MAIKTLILSAVSFIAGFIDSIAGGGGTIQIPALLVAGIPPQLALGTNKFVSVVGTSASLLNFGRHRKVLWRIVAVGIIFSLSGAFLGSKTILFFSEAAIGKIIVCLMPLAALAIFLPKGKGAAGVELAKGDLYLKVPLICLVLGFYDGFFGPGTGSFLILAFYALVGLDLVQASGTAKVFNLASGIGAFIAFLLQGKVLYLLGAPMALANFAGHYAGSALAIKKGGTVVRVFLGITLAILFASLLWKYCF